MDLRKYVFFKVTYWVARIGLGLTFIISGIRKFPGTSFTQLPVDDPVGAYFNLMHELGFYWYFIGYFQVLAGILAFFNRTVVVSSLLMMPVTVNIFMISLALHMRGTPIITFAMLLGNIFLMLWHYENYSGIIKKPIAR